MIADPLSYLREHEPSWHPLFLALALTGARFGEVSALHWDDIDTRANVIHIRRRTVPLPDHLATVLEAHRCALLEALSPGLARGLVFPTAAGKLYRTASLRKPHSRALAAADVEHRFSVHGFRRTFNNLLRQVASGEVVRSMTGHVEREKGSVPSTSTLARLTTAVHRLSLKRGVPEAPRLFLFHDASPSFHACACKFSASSAF